MKFPKSIKRNCPKCKKNTEHKVTLIKSGTKRSALKKGSIQRGKKRGRGAGAGNKGKWGSKPAITKFKRVGSKTSKTLNLRLTCMACNKSMIKTGNRVKKVELE